MTDPITEFPHALIAEKSILSAIFQNPGNIARAAAEGVTMDAFHIPAHRTILEYLIQARDAGHVESDGTVAVGVFLQSAQMDCVLDRMGGPSAIADIYSYAPTLAGWSAWCEQIRECKARRIAIEASETLAGATDSGEAIKAAQSALDAMRGAITAKTRSINAKESCNQFIAAYLASHNNGDLPGQSTGIGEIDAITGGAKPGELWVVSGPSSSGKSVLMYQIESEFLGEGRVVTNFSAELMAREIVGRLVTLRGRVPYHAITTPKEVTKPEMEKIKRAIHEMAQTRMWIDDSAGQSLDSIFSEAERIRDIEGAIGLIVVDYIQIIKGTRNKGDSREQEVASISGGLKQLAKKMGCPVIAGSQENDDGKTRESRAIEQDADVWLKITDDGILMKKVRNGKRDQTLNLALDGSAQRFRYFQPTP
jgi:replicative DNA helicase